MWPVHAQQTFPASYEQAVRQAQESCKAALADGKQLLEVEFPTAGLASVSGVCVSMGDMWAHGSSRN